MQKTKIEWANFTINPVKGLCPMACSYCYARRMYKRFHWNPEVRYDPNVMLDTSNINNPSKIFVGSTMELFGDWVKPEWLKSIFDWVKTDVGIHTYIFLTKQPHNLVKWSPFPENCWVGVSTTGMDSRSHLESVFGDIQAMVKFVSIEPLLDYSPMDFRWVDWVIVGRQTPISGMTQPRREWIQDIIKTADDNNIPVFLKDNLSGLLPFRQHYKDDYHDKCYQLRQEFPRIK